MYLQLYHQYFEKEKFLFGFEAKSRSFLKVPLTFGFQMIDKDQIILELGKLRVVMENQKKIAILQGQIKKWSIFCH